MNDGTGAGQAARTGKMIQSLRGARAHASLGEDLVAVLDWPEALRAELWELTQLALGPQLDDRLTTRLTRVARDHEIEVDSLLPPLKALRFLMREGAKNNAGPAAFIADVQG